MPELTDERRKILVAMGNIPLPATAIEIAAQADLSSIRVSQELQEMEVDLNPKPVLSEVVDGRKVWFRTPAAETWLS